MDSPHHHKAEFDGLGQIAGTKLGPDSSAEIRKWVVDTHSTPPNL